MITPKQSSSTLRRDWYPYYAGFTEDFVASVLARELTDADSVLDPWSGSGTTTAACVRRGISSVGVDVNPSLTIVARARLTPRSTQESLYPLAKRLVSVAQDRGATLVEPNDLLNVWMRSASVSRLRAIQEAIHVVLTASEQRPRPEEIERCSEELPQLACFFYCALFATARDVLRPFGTTNPMWLRLPDSPRQRITPRWSRLSETFLARVEYLRDRLLIDSESVIPDSGPFRTASAGELPFATGHFGAALTSPPYATRIDYVKGTIPELAVLGADEAYLRNLRRRTTGTPVLGPTAVGEDSCLSEYGRRVLLKIRRHPSKGSAGYYFPWMRGYVQDLQTGLCEMSRAVTSEGPVCVVVQDSYYKEMRIDLQRIVTEIMQASGRGLASRYDYAANNLRSRMNPRALRHAARRSNTESLLVFRRSHMPLDATRSLAETWNA